MHDRNETGNFALCVCVCLNEHTGALVYLKHIKLPEQIYIDKSPFFSSTATFTTLKVFLVSVHLYQSIFMNHVKRIRTLDSGLIHRLFSFKSSFIIASPWGKKNRLLWVYITLLWPQTILNDFIIIHSRASWDWEEIVGE